MSPSVVRIAPILFTHAAGQVLLALVLAAILHAFHRVYRRPWLRYWSLSWLALAVYMAAASFHMRPTSAGGGAALRVVAVCISVVAGYLQIAWLVLGTRGLARGEEVPRRTRRALLVAAVGLGLLSVPPALAGMARPSAIGLRCLAASLGYLAAAGDVLGAGRPLTGVGRRLMPFALLVYASAQLAFFGLGFVPRGEQAPLLPLLMTFDLLSQSLIGLALVAWLLEGERERQVKAIALTRRKERAQACVYRISEAARTVGDLPALFLSIHESIREVLPARNFYIALFDRSAGFLSFPYFVDERDPTPAPKPLGRGLTEYVLRTRQPLLATPEVFAGLLARGEVERIASDCVDWLGAPLLARGEPIGVAAVQTYDPTVRLGPEDRDLLVFVSEQIAAAIDAKRAAQADQALRDSEARLRQVIDLVPHFIFAKDEEGRFLLVNRAVAEAYGTTVDRLIGRTDADYARSEEEARHFRADDLEVIRSGRAKLIPEEPITDSRGRVRFLQTTKIPFTFSGTGRPAVLGVAIDITERKAAEEALRRAAKEESLTVLAGGVAHDFNNLLAAILGHAALASAQLPPTSPARRHVEKAASAVERAADLTRQMLAYSGRGHFVVRPTDVNALVRENLPLLAVAAPKNVRLDARLADGVPLVDADVGQIQQVLMNLVINAAEAIGERGGSVVVSTGVRDVAAGDQGLWRVSGYPLEPGPHVSLEVADDGPGMDADTVERIFEPFFTTKFTGRGLGLAAVLGVVRGHRGALSVESRPGLGTLFRLLFAPSRQAPVAETGPEPAPGPQRLTVLLIDDEEVVREMVREVLTHEGLEVLCAEDGAKGVALFREKAQAIDVVLLDLSMPGLGGEETYKLLREIDPGVPVILSSGYDHQEATRRFGSDGPAGFIQKPYRPRQLMAEIDRCLGREAN
jgi:PAS domain S-box-containing protein